MRSVGAVAQPTRFGERLEHSSQRLGRPRVERARQRGQAIALSAEGQASAAADLGWVAVVAVGVQVV